MRSVAHRVRSMESLVGWSSESVLAGGSGRSAVHRVLILALWEDRSAPHPAVLATQPRNHAGTAECIRGADPNDPPRAPFPASSGLRESLLRVIGSHGAPLASNRGSAGLLRVIGSRDTFESPSGAAPARPGAARTGPGAGVLVVAAVRAGPAAAQVVQICHKGLDLAGAPKENRGYSAFLLAADPAAAEVMGWSRSPTSGESLGVGCAAGSWPAAPGSAEGASGRLLRAFLSAALLHPPLRPFFSYSEGSRSVAEEEGRSRRECRRAARTRITAR